jgi:hypothetical protein
MAWGEVVLDCPGANGRRNSHSAPVVVPQGEGHAPMLPKDAATIQSDRFGPNSALPFGSKFPPVVNALPNLLGDLVHVRAACVRVDDRRPIDFGRRCVIL